MYGNIKWGVQIIGRRDSKDAAKLHETSADITSGSSIRTIEENDIGASISRRFPGDT